MKCLRRRERHTSDFGISSEQRGHSEQVGIQETLEKGFQRSYTPNLCCQQEPTEVLGNIYVLATETKDAKGLCQPSGC